MSADASANGPGKRQRLAARRKMLGLTQEALAALLGVERSTVVRWERGETEPLPWLQLRLARTLRMSVDQIKDLLSAERPPVQVPRQLPAAMADFTGRAAELQALTRMLDDAAGGPPGTVVISAIGGTAGVGKTALALHWAHRLAARFGDGQLYVNLRGFDPSGGPASPAEAVRGFLDALGVPPERVPPGPDAQAGLYRSLLASKRMLIVLDNARDEQQVRPLLPASPASLVVVTSRNQLTGLAAVGARLLPLDVLPRAEAVQLLTARIGTARAAAEPGAIAEIATLCARLPLALAVASARAAARPGFPLTALAAELRGAADRLDALETGDPAASVRAVFSWSYQQLSPEAARMFRLLGAHPGPDISVPAAASLAATTEASAARLLRELARDCLIAEHVPGRYVFHDLLRVYAAAQASVTDGEPGRHAAVARLLDHYLHTANAAAVLIDPTRQPVDLTAPVPGVSPEHLANREDAIAWLETDHHVLLAITGLAAAARFDTHAWQLPKAMAPYLSRRGHYQEWASTQRTALAAAERLGDLAGQATASRILANACNRLGDYEQAVTYHAKSLALCQRLGDRLGETLVHAGLSVVAENQGRYADALVHAEDSLRLYRVLGDRLGEARTLNATGWFRALLGDYRQARALSRQALTVMSEIGAREPQAHVWDSIGYAEHHLGNLPEAAACYERALGICREFGGPWEEATFLTHLADTCHAMGRPDRAREAWQQALAILDDVQHPDADNVRAKLASAGEQTPRPP
jgi:tetratricopeptide (TPR) repeat protein/DNA-binding XRE family transcriptional regulator